ncbi:glycosyltransferase [Planotetraspora sp. GP83]|uniref:glycosyltransferase n=1 Tax=Planotetraspora sp. GP83 TaxID=3156264 RepID=UPI003514B631
MNHHTRPAELVIPDDIALDSATPPAGSPGAALLAMRGLFRGPSDLVDPALYAQVGSGAATLGRTRMRLEPATTVSGNTYFGRFPASHWQRWTRIPEVTVRLTATGSGRLLLGASDSHGGTRTVDAHTVTEAADTEITLTAQLDRFLDGGALWLDVSTGPGERFTVADVRWTVPAPARPRRTAATICTMDRPDACLGNLTALADDHTALSTLDAVYVVDQGGDRVRDRAGFPEAELALGGRLRYLTQPNLGGAGGFSRGLYEVAGIAADGQLPPDVLFMDDDVLLEPDLLVRMTAFAASAAQPLILGGQMLTLLHPSRLHAGAEFTDLDRARPGALMPHSPHEADLIAPDPRTGHPERQELRLDAGYNGWWACLIPAEVTAAIGYPLPLFFQGDDAEYSYRARAHGFPTLTLPGAGLWHTDFAWKDRDEINRYFIVRNYTIISALHGRFPLPTLVRTLVAEVVPYLLGMQYGAAATVIAAVEDFLAGPEVLADGGQEALARLRRLRARHPETQCHPATDVPGLPSNAIVIADPAPGPRLRDLALLKGLLAPLLATLGAPGRTPARRPHGVTGLPSDGGEGQGGRVYAAVRHADAHWWHVAALGTAVVTDASQRGVRLRRYDSARQTRLTRAAAAVLWRLLREGPRVRERYRAALPALSSRENWARLFGSSPDGAR